MSDIVEIGVIVEKRNEEKEIEIEWNIKIFSRIIFKPGTAILSPVFSFADVLWHLQVYPVSVEKIGFMNLRLDKVKDLKSQVRWNFGWKKKVKDLKSPVRYDFGLKKVDGSVLHLKKGIFERDHKRSDSCFISINELPFPCSTTTILCILKCEGPPSKLRKLIKVDTLSENFRSILFNKDSCDTTLLVMDKEYRAHKTVLMARSAVFASMFLHETSEKQTGLVTIPDCDPESFAKFLEFLYTGKLDELSPQNAIDLFKTSDKYDVQELKTFCGEFLLENLTVENLCDIVIIADRYDESKLLSAAQNFFNENLSEIFRSSEWDSLVKNNYRLAKKLLQEMSLKVKVAH